MSRFEWLFRRGVLRKLCVAALILGGTACNEQEVPKRIVHEEGEGQLVAHSGVGYNSAREPSYSPWEVTFGAFTLCVKDSASTALIQRVRTQSNVEPLEKRVFLRRVMAQDFEFKSDGSVAPGSTIVISAGGTPPDFRTPDASIGRQAGSFLEEPKDVTVSGDCTAAERPRRPFEARPFTELMIAIKVGAEGGDVDRVLVDYKVDGEEFTLAIKWHMIACGSAVELRRFCSETAK